MWKPIYLMNDVNNLIRYDCDLQDAVIPPVAIVGLLEVAEKWRLNTDSWFAGTAVSPGHLQLPETRLSYRQIATILKRALRSFPPGPVGIHVGSRDVLTNWGLLGFAMLASPTVADAVVVAMSWHQASGSIMDYEVEYGRDEFAIRLGERSPDPELRAFLCEEGCSAIVTLLRSAFGADAVPVRLEFAYERPAYADAYYRFFRCPVYFNAEVSRVYLDAELLDRPLPSPNPAQLELAVEAVKHLAPPLEHRPDIIAAVEGVLREHLRRPVTMGLVADRLAISERTLHRRLAQAGVRFGDIRDRVRLQRATTLLRDSTLPIGSIAGEVGFSDSREFRRAYLRWTGTTPSAQRAAAAPA